MIFSMGDILITFLFAAGLVVLAFALHFEAKDKAPFYVTLSTIGMTLTIAATFIAALLG